MKLLGQVPEPGIRHRRHLAVPLPLAEAYYRGTGGPCGVGDGREEGGAAHSLPRGRGRFYVGGRQVVKVKGWGGSKSGGEG